MKQGIDYIGIGIGALIFDSAGQLFLAKRSQNCRNERGSWETPGGSIKFGEKLVDALQREMKEEYGIDLKEIRIYSVDDHILPEEEQHWVAISCVAKIQKEQKPSIMEPDKCDDIGFFELENLPNPLSKITMIALEKFKQTQL